MGRILIALASAGVLLSGGQVLAGDSPSENAPGQQMQSESAPGASEYAPPRRDDESTPGQQMKDDTGPGASEHAPGHDKSAASKDKHSNHPTE